VGGLRGGGGPRASRCVAPLRNWTIGSLPIGRLALACPGVPWQARNDPFSQPGERKHVTEHLFWWQWGGIAWIVLGLALVAVFALETELLRGKPLPSIAVSGFLVATAPFIFLYGLLYGLGLCCQSLWEGRIPISNHVWWPARSAKFDRRISDLRPDRESILVQMIEQRRPRDPRLRKAKRADDWPMFQLWETPEAIILDTIEDFRWLKDADLNDQSALQRLEDCANGNTSASLDRDVSVREYIVRRLKMADPSYLTLGDAILVQQIETAEKWVRDEIQWTKSEPAFPPTEWLKKTNHCRGH
jgi:hypothetical protein